MNDDKDVYIDKSYLSCFEQAIKLLIEEKQEQEEEEE
jgi:hypothetical protein